TPPERFGSVPSPPDGGAGTTYPSGTGTLATIDPEALHSAPGHHWPLSHSGRSGADGARITISFSTSTFVRGRFAATYCAPVPIGMFHGESDANGCNSLSRVPLPAV